MNNLIFTSNLLPQGVDVQRMFKSLTVRPAFRLYRSSTAFHVRDIQ